MMKNLLKIIFLFVAALAVLAACSKDDVAEAGPIDQDGGEIFRYQAVTINVNGVVLSENEYQATFAGEEVVVRKSSANTLVFSVSPYAPLGNADLIISSLNGATFHYNVKDTALTDTPENTLAPFITSIDDYSDQIGVTTIPEYQTSLSLISAFHSFYNDADMEQKEAMAKLYKANKVAFDFVLMQGINGVTGRFTPTDFATVSLDLFRASVEGVVIGAAVIGVSNWLISNPPLFTALKVVGAVLAGVALGLCAESLRDFIVAKAKAVKLNFASIFGSNDRNSFVSFQNDVSLVTPVSTHRRSVDMSDASSGNSLMGFFFSSYSIYSDTISTINDAIDYINNYNPFYAIPNLVTRQIPGTSQPEQEVMTQEIFQKLELSVNHPNLEIVSKSLQSDGQINMKIKIIGTPSSMPVESFLNYSYSDEFSSFSGSLPIKVEDINNISLVGNWLIVGYGAGSYDSVTGLYSSYVSSETFSNTCTGPFNTYTGDHALTFTFSNNVVFTANGFSMSYSKQRSGQFCDASYGESQCSYMTNYTYSSILTSTPTIQLNNFKNISYNYSNQVSETCSPYYDNNGQQSCTTVGDPYCEGYSLNETYSGGNTIRINIKDDENIIYLTDGGVQFKLMRQ